MSIFTSRHTFYADTIPDAYAHMAADARANVAEAMQLRTEPYAGPFVVEIDDPTGPFYGCTRRTREAAYAAGLDECQTRGLDPVLISVTDRFGKSVPMLSKGI